MSRKPDYLFSESALHTALSDMSNNMLNEINAFDKDYLLNTSTEDLVDYLEEKYKLETPVLLEDDIHIAQAGEADIDVSQDRLRHIRDRSQPYYLKGRYVEFAVPFNGGPGLFSYRATRYSTAPPYGFIQGNTVRFRFDRLDHDHAALNRDFQNQLASLKQFLEWTENDVNAYNHRLRGQAKQAIEFRKDRLLKDAEMVAALGFPLKKREDASATFTVPVTRKKPVIRKPQPTEGSFAPEPALADQEYEQILSIISNMVHVMELSPAAFADMGEEDLRTHFLVQLNGQYEGQATGETFNNYGKTDILIRVDGKNIFIAECKFWKGPKSLGSAIDQLLGYSSWRDTKTAIILFNRNKDLSSVLEKIPKVVEAHNNYKRTISMSGETNFRFILHQKDDPNREIILSILVFDVPE